LWHSTGEEKGVDGWENGDKRLRLARILGEKNHE